MQNFNKNFFPWQNVKLKKLPDDIISFSDFESTFKKKYYNFHNPNDVPKGLRPITYLSYINHGGFLSSYSYFLVDQQSKALDYIFIPDFLIKVCLEQKVLRKFHKIRVFLKIAILDCNYGFPGSNFIFEQGKTVILNWKDFQLSS